EAERLPALLDALRDMDAQFIVVDAGSTDGSADVARQCGATLLETAPGRARQMNAGAAAAIGDVLLFVHADTQLPPQAGRLVLDALSGKHVWGRFDVVIEGRPALLRVVAALMSLRSRLSGIATGDQ